MLPHCFGCGPWAPKPSHHDTVTLNVGGQIFTTCRGTLKDCPKLRDMLEGPPAKDGSYFLDRDGRLFSHILNFLRDGDEFALPLETDRRRLLSREAAFFGLSALSDKLSDVYVGAPIPQNEDDRLARLSGLKVLHTDDQEPQYNAIARIIAALIDVPIALVSLVTDDHQWFKAKIGIDATTTPRCTSFCAYTFEPVEPEAASMFVIENARSDPRVQKNPLVVGPPHIVFYAGSPLITSDGIRLGALCVIDRVPRSISSLQAQLLVSFSILASQEIERTHLLEAAKDAREADADKYMSDGMVPEQSDYAAGSMRTSCMLNGLTEAVLLVRIQVTSEDWPVMFANRFWTEMTRVNITPPQQLPGWAEATGPGMSDVRIRPGRRDIGLFDWLTLVEKSSEQLQREIRVNWGLSEPTPFMLKGRATFDNEKQVMLSCRFMPAELPINAIAATIRPLPRRRPGEKVWPLHRAPGRFYFVTMSKCGEPQPVSSKGSELQPVACPGQLPTSDTMPRPRPSPPASNFRSEPAVPSCQNGTNCDSGTSKGSRARKGNSVEALASIRAPPSPFSEVRLLRLVGQGSFGKVFYGHWMGSPVAVKTVESCQGSERKFEPDFEALLSTTLAHPNLVQTYMSSTRSKPSGEDGGDALCGIKETWMVQEWCDRGTLGTLCKKPRTDHTSTIEVIELCIDICGGGAYLHSRGIIHGDLTANNVLIKTQVTRKGYICKICDFGLARVLEGDGTGIMTTQLGTVTHMPPELFSVSQEDTKLTVSVDTYAVGILLWQVVTGEVPYANMMAPQVIVQSLRGSKLQMPAETPEKVSEIYDQCTHTDPDSRPLLEELSQQFTTMLAEYLSA